MKLGEIQNIYVGLSSTLNKKLPMKVGFIINRNLKKMQPIIDDLDKVRNETIEKYADRDENSQIIRINGNSIRIKDEYVEEFTETLNDVLDSDIEIEFDKFSLEDLEKCEIDGYDKLTVAEQGALETMIS